MGPANLLYTLRLNNERFDLILMIYRYSSIAIRNNNLDTKTGSDQEDLQPDKRTVALPSLLKLDFNRMKQFFFTKTKISQYFSLKTQKTSLHTGPENIITFSCSGKGDKNVFLVVFCDKALKKSLGLRIKLIKNSSF